MYYPPRKKPEQTSPESRAALHPPGLLPSGLEPVTPPPPPPVAQAEAPAPPEARRPRRRSCLPGCITGCLVVFLIIVVAPALLYYLEYRRCTDYTAARDPLFDTYAREVIARQAPRLFCALPDDPNPVKLPEEVLAGWEAEFGGDPRYWQLRYNCTAEVPPEIVADYEARGLSPRLYYLEQARERGIADLPVLWTLWAVQCELWADEILEAPDGLGGEVPADEKLDVEKLLIKGHGAEIRDWLDEMVAAAPDWSWPYYRRARFYWHTGERELALADLRTGNAAPVNRYPATFPFDLALNAARDDSKIANRTILGGLLDLEIREQTGNARAWMNFAREVAQLDIQRNREWFAAYHRFACRFGGMTGVNRFQQVVGISLAQIPVDELLTNQAERLTPEERQALLGTFRLKGLSWGEYRWQNDRYDQLRDEHRRLDPLYALSGGLLVYTSISLENTYYDAGTFIVDVDGKQRIILEKLAGFDYLTMSWPMDDPAADAAMAVNRAEDEEM